MNVVVEGHEVLISLTPEDREEILSLVTHATGPEAVRSEALGVAHLVLGKLEEQRPVSEPDEIGF